MQRRFFLWVCLCLPVLSWADEINYLKRDSLEIVSLLEKGKNLEPTESRVLFFAKHFVGVPYKSGILEQEKEERLTINLRELDCTTFVETVLALTLASKEANADFNGFVSALRKIRYRDGVVDGYCSRLHYFTDWAQDNQNKELILDVSDELSEKLCIETPNLNYMSSHCSDYPRLKDNPANLQKIKEQERRLSRLAVMSIPKELSEFSKILDKIADGSIVALTTAIEGLDVSHLGFAVRYKGKIHLLHASSVHKKVLIDPLSLEEYLRRQKQVSGIRVLMMSL